MTSDKRKGWLKGLEVGDSVIVVVARRFFPKRKEIATVAKITPSGMIDVETQTAIMRFMPNGSGSGWLEEATQEAVAAVNEENFRRSLSLKLKKEMEDKLWGNDSLTAKQIEDILAILSSADKDKA